MATGKETAKGTGGKQLGIRLETNESSEAVEQLNKTTNNWPDGQDDLLPHERAWIFCLKVEAVSITKHRACLNRRHDAHLLQYGRTLGWKTLLQDIRENHFTMLDYFYRTSDGRTSMWGQKAIEVREAEAERFKEEGKEDWFEGLI